MLKILITALLLTANPDIELKTPIEWQITFKVTDELVIKSYYSNIEMDDIDKAIYFYAFSINEFTRLVKSGCKVKPLEIRIITEEQMNSPVYFTYIDPIIYGRYFRENQHMYLTLEAVRNKKYFAHEMAHYLFDTCNINFKNSKIEHVEVEKFLRQLGRK